MIFSNFKVSKDFRQSKIQKYIAQQPVGIFEDFFHFLSRKRLEVQILMVSHFNMGEFDPEASVMPEWSHVFFQEDCHVNLLR